MCFGRLISSAKGEQAKKWYYLLTNDSARAEIHEAIKKQMELIIVKDLWWYLCPVIEICSPCPSLPRTVHCCCCLSSLLLTLLSKIFMQAFLQSTRLISNIKSSQVWFTPPDQRNAETFLYILLVALTQNADQHASNTCARRVQISCCICMLFVDSQMRIKLPG